MAHIIAIVNQKGGVGKTTSSINIAAGLYCANKRTLLVDFDPQANATSGFGVDRGSSPHIYDVLINEVDASKAVVSTPWGDLLPSNKALAGAELELIGAEEREFCLRRALRPLHLLYDYIIIDCPPSIGLLTLNALCASNAVLVPVQCEYYALEGLSNLTHTIRLVKQRLNPTLSLQGVVLTMFDNRTNLSSQVADEVKRHFPGKVYKTVIPRNVRLSESPSHGLPIFGYDKLSRGAIAYGELVQEIVTKK
ncbi:MAG: AAA family ATPase [Oscillospiraceae bacterium]|nr:AAA family ATPase [Oscillospiraceae bacterium]